MGKVAEGERQTGRGTVEKALPWKATEPRPTPQKPLSGEGKRRGGGLSLSYSPGKIEHRAKRTVRPDL